MQRGFTYVGLMIFLAVMALATTSTVEVESLISRRAQEERLLQIGNEFIAAIRAYGLGSPAGSPEYPADLAELAKDSRSPTIKRYIRKIYADPITGKAQWGVIRGPTGGIIGVYSLAPGVPIKRANFPKTIVVLQSSTYADWKFTVTPQQTGVVSGIATSS